MKYVFQTTVEGVERIIILLILQNEFMLLPLPIVGRYNCMQLFTALYLCVYVLYKLEDCFIVLKPVNHIGVDILFEDRGIILLYMHTYILKYIHIYIHTYIDIFVLNVHLSPF